MAQAHRTNYTTTRSYVWVLLCLLFSFIDLVRADEAEDRRVDISLSLYPRVLAVDLGFKQKLDQDGKARLLFIYQTDRSKALRYARKLQEKFPSISHVSVRVDIGNVDDVSASDSASVTAYFIAERLTPDAFERIREHSVEQGRILFSPYPGDVERGATIGIMITSRVQPYLNMATIKQAGIELNPLLVKLARRYE